MKKLTLAIVPVFLITSLLFNGCGANNNGASSLNFPGDTNTFSFSGSGPSQHGGTLNNRPQTPLQVPPLPDSDSKLAPHALQQIVIRFTNVTANQVAASVNATVLRTFSVGPHQYATLVIPNSASIVQTIQKLKTSPNIVTAEPNWYRFFMRLPTGTGYTQYQWGPQKVNAPAVWTGGLHGSTGDPAVVIGIMDSGINGAHTDLLGNVIAGFDYADNFGPASGNEGAGTTSCPTGLVAFAGGGCTIPAGINSDTTGSGHGTFVASVAGAKGDDANPSGMAGMCWHCSLEPIKIWGSNGNFTTTDLEVQALADAATAPNARLTLKPNIINMSFGAFFADNAEMDGISYALQNGIVLVASAGNSANANLTFPASYPGVIAVGATDANDHLTSFSTQGAFLALAAPGLDMYGASNTSNTGYQLGSGSSFAAPTTAGALGLLDSILIDNAGALLTPDKAATLLETTADKVAAMNGSNFTPGFGYGRLNVLNAANNTNIASKMGGIKLTVDVGGQPACDWDVLLENSSGQAVNDTLTGDGSSTSPLGTTNFGAGTAYFFLVPTSGNPYSLVVEPPKYPTGVGQTCGTSSNSNAKQTVPNITVVAGSTVNAGTTNF